MKTFQASKHERWRLCDMRSQAGNFQLFFEQREVFVKVSGLGCTFFWGSIINCVVVKYVIEFFF